MSGLLLVDKPPGPTSHDVVKRVREWSGMRKVGHLGTLDPAAEGLVIVCVGEAVKLVPWLEGFDKEYRVRLRLGMATDTQDTTGTVLAERPLAGLDEGTVRAACEAFRGEILQVPPMFSALKFGGWKLVDIARSGRQVERAARPATVHEIEIESIALPEVAFRVRVSKGTYVRTLCHDIGAKLDCGGAMSWLRRTRSGPFDVRDAHPLDRLPPFPQGLRPVLEGLVHLPRATLDPVRVDRVRHGRRVPSAGLPDGAVALLDESGRLFAIGRAGEGTLRPVRVLEPGK